MPNKKGCKKFHVSCVILIIFFLVSGCNILSTEPYYYIPVATHQVSESLGLKEAWTHEKVFIQDNNLSPMMVASQGIVTFLGGLDRDDNSTITALGAREGTLQWQHEARIPTAIFASPFALYVGNSGGASVAKYALDTGRSTWQTPLPGTRGLAYLSVIEDDVHVQTGATHDKFFVLDANTGEIVRQMEASGLFMSTNGVSFQHSIFTNELEARDTNTQNLLWIVKMNHQFLMVPVFTEHEILVRTDVGGIYCLERETGIVKWQIENIAISNLVVAQDIVYFLTREGKLQGVDLRSGELKHYVQFDTDRFVLNGEAHIGGFNVAFDPKTEMLFAQLGDSAQLFAFQVSEK